MLRLSRETNVCYLTAVISRSHEGPGEMGKAVNIPKNDQEKMKELFKINQFNLMASDMIALNRSLPDVRLDGYVSFNLDLLHVAAVNRITVPTVKRLLKRIFTQMLTHAQGCGSSVVSSSVLYS